MTRITVARTIAAPAEAVFGAVTDFDRLSEIDPQIVGVEYLTESRRGLGTRFRETRDMNGRQLVTELEVTEYVPNERARMVADTHGTIWDTVFTVEPAGGGVELTIAMDARPHKWLPKLMNPLMKPMFRRGMERHIDKVKGYCEERAGG